MCPRIRPLEAMVSDVSARGGLIASSYAGNGEMLCFQLAAVCVALVAEIALATNRLSAGSAVSRRARPAERYVFVLAALLRLITVLSAWGSTDELAESGLGAEP